MARDFRPKDKGGASKPKKQFDRGSKGNDAHGRPSSGGAAGRNGGGSFRNGKGPASPANGGPQRRPQNGFGRPGERRPQKDQQEPAAPGEVSMFGGDSAAARAASGKAKGKMIFNAQPLWMSIPLEPLPSEASSSAKALTEADIASAYARGERALHEDKARYSALLYGTGGEGKQAAQLGSLGSLSASDARFIASLLSSTTGAEGSAATLSDRVSALTLLVQSSPLHNLQALDRLFGMCKKKSRQEAGRATRALADWLASPGGLGPTKGGRKLRYFRDQPLLPQVVQAQRSGASSSAAVALSIDQHLGLFVFEDYLKKFYFHFLQLLEAQSHDTLPFVRSAAVSQMYHLLRDQSEQEQNVLRLLVNKLGDTEKSVASRASGHLLELLNVHPAMKAIVAREVAQIILQTPSGAAAAGGAKQAESSGGKGKGKAGATGSAPPAAAAAVNLHARYYGVLTLNQTMLTSKDTDVANMLVELYFDLFEGLLAQQAHVDKDERRKAGGDAADDADADNADAEGKKDKKPRWKDAKKGGKGKQQAQPKSNQMGVEEAHSKMVAAILAGVRRAFPFARLGSAIFDKHIETLFRVTHTGSFNISIQALQLIFQVAVASERPPSAAASAGSKRPEQVSASSSLADRFYRTLYDSLLDGRLATSSKQAMYLNLLFKALKADEDPDRKKAFVKRLCQVLCMHDPPFVCGALFLLGELFKINPAFKGMLEDPEEDGEEHFRDVDDEDDASAEDKQERSALAIQVNRSTYDGRKRDPRFANAQLTCLWDILPLTRHFHPSVALTAAQLLRSEQVTASADLSLNTLSHFLDRFVYRNPKKVTTKHKGASIMQPAEAASGRGAAGLETGVVNMRGKGLASDEYVNSEQFWRKNKDNVPVDQLFFHQYFNQRAERNGVEHAEKGADDAESGDEDEEDEDESEMPAGGVGEEMSDTDEEEAEIWKAMKATMPGGDELDFSDDGSEGDEDDEDLAALDYTDSDESDGESDSEDGGEPGLVEGFEDAIDAEVTDDDEAADSDGQDFQDILDNDSDDDEGIFEEDEDDLLPFADFDGLETAAATAGKKRGAEEDAAEPEAGKKLSKGQQKRALKKQRKETPVFASADDYAHMMASDDEDSS